MGDPMRALSDFQQAYLNNPENPDYLYEQGQCQQMLEQWEDAYKLYKQAISLCKDKTSGAEYYYK